MIGLSKSQARRFLLLKHGLLGPYRFRGKSGALEYVRQAGCIQFDPVDVCGKNAELVLQAEHLVRGRRAGDKGASRNVERACAVSPRSTAARSLRCPAGLMFRFSNSKGGKL